MRCPGKAPSRCARANTFRSTGGVVLCSSSAGYAERANTLLTDLSYQRPPRGVAIPRAFWWTWRRSGWLRFWIEKYWCLESRATGIGAASARTTAVGSRSHSSPTIGRPSRWAQSQGELDMPGIGFCSTSKGRCLATYRLQFSDCGPGVFDQRARSGWTVGIGGEYAFLDWLTGFIEYDHYGFGDSDNGRFGCGFACPVGTFGAFPGDFRTDVDVVKAGLNVKFFGAGPFASRSASFRSSVCTHA